ncbi:cell surface protein SprA [Lutibacter sp. Hel_I_33_5]|uniref:T9SS outer membrane translocon Sov/SprA n=1 Tax=Lutibacter sp. Hel_I_33_5 TaxID=1566289 RepID=UPI0021022DAE|nr:cell surface protein SprA [Lutibacter sp. Hel_I_33_5]
MTTFAFSQADAKKDTLAVKKDTIKLKYNFKHAQNGGLFLKDPAKYDIIFDKNLNKYVLVEKIGDYYARNPIFMSPREYGKYRLQRDMLDYYKSKVSATNSKKKGSKAAQRNLLPTYYVNSDFFESIFGGNTIKVTPTGNLNLKLGFIYQNTDNPQLSEENRSSFTFDFDQQINASIQAKVGKRLTFTANYDTQSTFDFQNLVKVEFTPTEDDILQGFEAGNVAMPIKNSLINGAQSLFGVKTQLKFGNTNITAVFSQQNSESKTVTAEAGASIQPFEIRATDYDNDRHFFLGQYFRENYKQALSQYPLINSPINITRIEVWITNRNASVEDFRSIVAFADIGESKNVNLVSTNGSIQATNPPRVGANNLPANEANNLSTLLVQSGGIRDVSSVSQTLDLGAFQMQQGTDYSLLQNARKLEQDEFTLNPQLGFISLNRRLNDGEVLAVSYEYTVVGASGGNTSFKVGEFSNDGIQAPDNLAVKLLRSEILQTKREVGGVDVAFPTWKLMMKNVYALGAFPLTQEGFRFEIQYRDDETGIPSNTLQNATTPNLSIDPLIQVFGLDQLDQSQFKTADGFFDYVEGITVNSQNGYVIFPEPEPFGEDLDSQLTTPDDKKKYLFNELYLNTKINVKNNFQNKDKYLLKGYFKSENSGGIPIGAFNVPRGSVKVTAGGRQLVEGVDYVVDYQLGRVQIIDPGLQSSGIPINVSTENNSIFNQQRKTFFGIDVEHKFSDNLVVGGTFLNVNERPITPKVNFGAEPIDNTILGLNLDFSRDMPIFTKWANKLPFVDTEVESKISVKADMAYLIPGSPSGIDVAGAATSYVDDFEASQIPISLLSPLQWYNASTPQNQANTYNGASNDLSYNFKRSRLAWYSVDQIFYGAGQTPNSVDADELSRAETRQISFQELFPNTQLDITQNTLVRTLDLAYFPSERGSYNFDTRNNTVDGNGNFLNPQDQWGGIMRPLNTNNFDQANVEYIQFWIMDPYENYSITEEEGLRPGVNPQDQTNQVGDLYINLGNVSEDINRDGFKMYENGLPADGNKIDKLNVLEPKDFNDNLKWGFVPINQSIVYAFDEDDAARVNQDVGFDGLNDTEEINKYQNHPLIPNFSRLDQNDPSNDNYQFFRGTELDNENASILKRYKKFNNTQGNSPTSNQSPEAFPTSANTYPDVEDINRDQTMNTVESYFEYKISMNKSDLVVGRNFVVDEKTTTVTLENGGTQNTKWYQFRVPVRSGTPVNGVSDFNSIRFIRMFMTNFKMPVVLRFGELGLVRGDWRRYTRTLDENIDPDRELTQPELNDFEVGVVNIEQNENRYVLPPGIVREQLQGTTTIQQQNEQSVSLKVKDLPSDGIRAIYKNISVDLRRYKQLKMFVHMEEILNSNVDNTDLLAIIRLGTDLNDNFYQLEIPLQKSSGSLSPLEVWPEANNLDAALEELGKVKLERDGLGLLPNELYTSINNTDPSGVVIKVKGNPTLAQLRTIMLGVKNRSSQTKSAEVWFNELRSVGFDNKGGWAAVINADANFADVANVSLSGRMQTIGFGNVEDRVQQRSLDETKQYTVNTSLNLGKMFTPKKWGIQLPMNYSIGEEFINPKFDPQYQDVKLEDAIDQNPNSKFSSDYTKRTSISFNNVKKNRNPNSSKKPKFYDVENVSVSYAFNKEEHRDYNIERYENKSVRASASYNFSFPAKSYEPFKKSDFFKGKYWKFIRDINVNPFPKTFAVNSTINRNFTAQRSRNLIQGLAAQPRLAQRRFLFDWDYAIGFDLTKSLQFNFNATNSYIYDAFGSGEELEIFDNFFNTGNANRYNQKLNATYKLPLNKIPYLGFLTADYGYTADFNWEASSQDTSISDKIGNVVQNANTHNLNANINFSKFYKTIGLDKLLTKRSKKTAPKTPGLPSVPGKAKTGVKKKQKTGAKILKGLYDVITSVKTAKLSYSENNGQFLPGYGEQFGFLGGPSTSFAFGSQVDIRNTALQNGWLITPRDTISTADPIANAYFNKTYSRTHYNKFDYNLTVKPVRDLNIDLRANRIKTRDLSQQLDIIKDYSDPSNLNGVIDRSIPGLETGNFSTSYSMLSTVFSDSDVLFQKMKDNRVALSSRLAVENGIDINDPNNVDAIDGTIKGFGANSQQVLMPAFVAAYSGDSPNSVSTGLFKNIPIPNWTLRYNGFMKFKWFKKNFSTFVVSHGYKSSYTVASFTNNLQYGLDTNNQPVKNAAGDFEPELLISSVSLIDEFSPLIKVDMKMKNSISLRGEIKRDRALTLNFNNSTLTDIKGTEYVFGVGYVIKDVKFSTRFTGKKETLKGDINLRADVSLRDNITLIRSVDLDNNQVSGGQNLFSIKFTADYRLNSNLTASFYYNHQSSKYAISTTFPRQSINAGFNIIYNLGN